MIPSSGNRAKGTRAVTATGTASVAHHTPINRNKAAVLWASIDSVSGVGRVSTVIADRTPKKKPLLSSKKLTLGF